MLRHAGKCKFVLFALGLFALSTQAEAEQKSSNPKPPIAIGGFAHEYLSRGQVHMNVCRQSSCVPGSKVSYQIYSPDGKPNFEDFKLVQKKVASHFKARAPKGTKLKFGKPTREKDRLFTTFTNYREMHFAGGAKQFTKSMVIYAEKVTISLISSSSRKKTAEANSDLFLIGLMTWSQTLKDAK